MGWISLVAVFFIMWWLVLFAILPLGLRTQDEDDDVTLGTTSSAPRGPHMLRAILVTTVVSLAIVGLLYVATRIYGFSFDDIPRVVPTFEK